MTKRVYTTILCLLFSLNVFASSAEYFHKRFEIKKVDGKSVAILDNFLKATFDIGPYIKFIKEQIKKEQALMDSKSDYFSDLRYELGEDMKEKGYDDPKQIEYVVDSMKALRDLDVDAVFSNPKFKEVISKFQGGMSDALAKIGLNVMAKIDDPKFFYKRNVTYEVVKMALNFARQRLSTVPLLNTAFYVIVEVERLIRERRTYHQNMMLHYFEKFNAEDLGLTHNEVNLAMSSVYESRIPWYAFWESSMAVDGWQKYGVNIFFRNIRSANNRFRQYRDLYNSLGDRVDYAFRFAVKDGEEVIVNMFDSEHMFDAKPATAHFVNKPYKVMRKRLVLQLAQLGLSFVSLPAFIKDFAGSFMKSFYVKQKLTEGALHAFFESNNNMDMRDLILLQNLNPFEPRLDKLIEKMD